MKKVALASLVMLLSLCTYAEGSRNLAPRSSTGTGITNDENAFLFVPSSVYANNTETGLSKLSSLPATSGTQPNIVVILVDDAGYDDFGFQGSTIAISPNIDLLASEGMVFSQGYVSAGLCAPSRAGIMTGQNQNKLGFTYNIASNVDASSAAPGHTLADIGLDPNVPTMGDFMQELGYETALFGKWHLGFGAQTQHHPNNRGFDFFYGLLGGSRPYDQTTTDTDKQLQRDGVLEEPTNNNFFVTDLLTDEALVFMSTQIGANKPFLAFMSYTAPHGPYTAKPADKALFDPVSGIDDVDRNYYGLLKNVDDNIKRIVDHLKNLNEYDNTLFVFLSDNGGVVQDAGSNGLLRSGKGSSYEGGIRVPFFMTWKNMVPVGGTYNHQVISTDLLPTFIKAAGGDLTDNEYFDLEGKDLVAAAISGTAIHSRLYWRKGVGGGVVSDGTNKVRFTQGSMFSTNTPPELYNLDSDIGESTNLYASNTALAQNLLTDFGTWSQSIETPSWIPSGVVSNECGGSTNISTCSFLTNYYSTFAANSALTQEANTPLSMNQTTETITQSNLEFTDPVKSEGSISYELTQLPQSGTINRSGQPLSLGDSFTQRDINTGEITYTSSNNPANPDNMVFSVNDGAGGEELTNVTFAFTLPANYNASLDSDGDGIIDADDLDDDNDGILDVDEYNFTNNINVHPFSLGLTIPANFGDPGIDNQGGTYDMSARLGLPAGTAFITITNSATVEATQGSNGIFNLDPAETSQITITSSYPLQLRPRMGPSFNNQNDDRGIISNDGKAYSFDGTISDPAIYSHTNVGSTYTLAAIGVPPAPPNNLSVNEENAFWVCSEVSTSFDLTYFANGSGSNYNIVIRVPVDTDGDGNPDYLDLDSDGDGIPDIVEAGGTDGNNDGEVDYPTLGDPTSMVDANLNGWSSVFDDGSTGQATESGTPLADADTDGDGFNNRLDIDSDADGIVDNIEGQTSAGYVAPTGTDTDNDGIDNSYDPDNGGTAVTPINTDGAGNPDYLSLDSDGDGRSDHVEGYDTDNPTDGSANTFAAGTDTDGDGLDDNFDLFDATSPPATGSNSANGVQTAASFPDTDDPGDEPNWREFNFDLVNDLDGDGITDANDLDDDNDGILDEDEYNFTQININAPQLFPGASPGDEPADGTVDVSAILGLPSGTVEIEHIDAYVNASNANQLNVRTGANPRYIIRSTYPLQLRPRMGRSNFQTLTTDPERGFTSNDGKTFQFTNSGALNSGFSPVNSSNNYVIKRDDGITTGGTAASSGNLFWESDDFATSFDISFLEQGGGTNVLLAFNVPVDTDGDGIPDFQDADSDNDGIPDIVEAGGVDANGDGQVDYPTPGDASSMVDANGNGWSSVFDDGSADASATESGTPLTDADTDTDLVPNRLDVDSDNDGIADVIEGQGTAAYKAPTGNDADTDGIDDAFDSDFDASNKLSSSPINTDENNIAAFNPDAVPDYLDNDSDGDGVTDQVESGVTADVSGTDTDGDGLLDDYDNFNASSPPGAPSGVNADNNGQTATNPFPTAAVGGNNPTNPGPQPDWRFNGLIIDVTLSSSCATADIPTLQIDVVATGFDPTGLNAQVTWTAGTFDIALPATTPASAQVPVTVQNITIPTATLNGGTGNYEVTFTTLWPGAVESGGAGTDWPGWVFDDNGSGIWEAKEDGYSGYRDAGTTVEVLINPADEGVISYPPASPTCATDPPAVRDTDKDGIPDITDIDDDNDGIPDLAETGGLDPLADGDADGVPAQLDDDDANNAVGNDDVLTQAAFDADGDGVPNHLDLDSDNDGIPDIAEAGGLDVNGDGLIDDATDTDDDGLGDVYDTDVADASGNSTSSLLDTDANGSNDNDLDSDGDGIPNFRDLDADNDGISDIREVDITALNGTNGTVTGFIDADENGYHDGYDPNATVPGTPIFTTGADTDADGLPNSYPTNSNNDGGNLIFPDNIPNFLDIDEDNDGMPGIIENGGTDVDRDGRYGSAGVITDTDNNGWEDSVDPNNGGTEITPTNFDGDARPDYVDSDSDNDLVPDKAEHNPTAFFETVLGTATDANGDGFQDEFNLGSYNLPTNTDGTGLPDYLDIDADDDGKSDSLEVWDLDQDGVDLDDDINRGNPWTDLNGDGLDDAFVGWFTANLANWQNVQNTTQMVGYTGVGTEPSYRSAGVTVIAFCYLEGPYTGGATKMNSDLSTGGATSILATNALTQPYAAAPWSYAGGENVAANYFATNANAVDWILVELRDAADASSVVGRRVGVLFDDGTIDILGGPITGASASSYHVAIRHRNHGDIVTANPITVTSSTITWDTRTDNSNVFTDGVEVGVKQIGSDYVMYGGDSDRNNTVNASDIDDVSTNFFLSGYYFGDHNMDGVVNASDITPVSSNFFLTIAFP